MANLFDGARVLDFVLGVTPITAVFLNELQDQLKDMLGPRWLWIPLLPSYVSPTATSPYWDNSDGHLDGGNQDSSIARLPVPCLRVGDRITGSKCIIAGAATKAAGSVTLVKYDADGTLTNYSMKAASAWPTAGIGFANASELAGVSVNHTMLDGEYCIVEVNFGADQAAKEGEVWGLALLVQSGS